MIEIKNKSLFRLSLSGAALALYLLYCFFRVRFLLDLSAEGMDASFVLKKLVFLLIGLVPLVSQLLCGILADFTKRINKRVFVTLFFIILLIQHWFMFFEAFTSFQPHLSAISNVIFEDQDFFDNLVYVFTFFAALFIAIANTVMVKLYAVVLTALNGFAFVYHSVFLISGEAVVYFVLFSLIGVLFSLSLYTFSDYLTEDNVFGLFYEALYYIGRPIFGDRYDKNFCNDEDTDGYAEDLYEDTDEYEEDLEEICEAESDGEEDENEKENEKED